MYPWSTSFSFGSDHHERRTAFVADLSHGRMGACTLALSPIRDTRSAPGH